jgi:hypothetical protein
MKKTVEKYKVWFYQVNGVKIVVEASDNEEAGKKAVREWMRQNTPPIVAEIECTSNQERIAAGRAEYEKLPYNAKVAYAKKHAVVGSRWVNNKSGIEVTIASRGYDNLYLARAKGRSTKKGLHYFAGDYSPVEVKE